VGDTFRWKGENVSTNEVAEHLGQISGVEEVNVYGVPVPGADGKAGMAGLVTNAEFDITKLAEQLVSLPAYARPVFVRLQRALETTGTFKYRKMDLVAQGYDPSKTDGEPVFVRDGENGYVPMTAELFAAINSGEFRI